MKKYILFSLILGAFWAHSQPLGAQALVEHQLTMWTTGQHTLWDGQMVRYYGFADGYLTAPMFPGPVLYANEGDSVIVRVRNQSQGAKHTIHWHGLDVDQANDGVPHLSFEISHEQDTAYYFRAPHPGTYLYHCHVASVIHVQMGMYGNFVVLPADGSDRAWTGGPEYDSEKIWLLSEIDKSWHDTIPHHSTGDSAHAYFNIPEYAPDYFLVNGRSEQQLTHRSTEIAAKRFEKVYLRVSDVGFFRNRIQFPAGANPEILASDGRALPASFTSDTLNVYPGERFGIMLSPTTEFQDSVRIDYIGLNNDSIWNTQWVPFTVQGHIGVEDPEPSPVRMEVYPNPAMDWAYLNWEIPAAGDGTIAIHDMTGRKVAEFAGFLTVRGGRSLDLRGLTSGTYILRLRAGDYAGEQRLMIQH